MNCHCHSGKPFMACCQPYLQNLKQPKTAEALMRSRYTAFCLNNTHYLNRTTTTPIHDNLDTAIQWTKLTIVNTHQGTINDFNGTVEFKAYYTHEESLYELHENSYFIKENNEWLYAFGDPITRKIGTL